MRLRLLAATAVAAVAAATLTACDSNAGAAAVVDGHRISDTEVNDYVRPGGTASASAQGQRLLPKTTALSYLVQAEVFRKVLAENGGVPSDAELSAVRGKAAETLLQVPLKGAELDKYVSDSVVKSGFQEGFADLLFETIELEQTLIDRTQAQNIGDLAKATDKADVSVSVSQRYGSWDPQRLEITDPTGQTPDFLKLESSAPANPAS